MSKNFILACDGGGIRGYITASVLQKLASSPGLGDFLSKVSLHAGTSTGSFISLGLAAGLPIDTIQARYQQASAAPLFTPNPNITGPAMSDRAGIFESIRDRAERFIRGHLLKDLEHLVNASYSNTGVKELTQSMLGKDTTLSQLGPVLITTLQLADATVTPPVWTPLSITNSEGSPFTGMLGWEAALCSSAAPIYFPPYNPTSVRVGYCADGVLFAANPSLAAIANALHRGVPISDLYVLSLDTGTNADGMSAEVIDGWGGPLSMGPVQWLLPYPQVAGGTTTPKFPLLSAMMDAGTMAVTLQSAMLLRANYFRVTVPMTAAVDLDDASTAAYAVMDASLAQYYASPGFTAATRWIQTHFPTA
jgi:patatin-like phospholipase/acyl hydrolase